MKGTDYAKLDLQLGLHREPVLAFAPKSAVAKAYQALWNEINKQGRYDE